MTDGNNVLENILNGIASRASEQIQPNEGDYIVDGLLYCHKCDTPKQCKVEVFGTIKTPMCLCKCETERRNKEREEYERQQRLMRIQELRKMGFPESEMMHWTFATDDLTNPKITHIAQNYVEHFEEMKKRGKGLLFFGSCGTGKTFAAACIANALIDKGYPCMTTNFARLINTISGMYEGKQQYIDGLNKFDLLIIDDLATERNTEYVNEIVQNIIDNRYRAGLPTIITTNLTSDELKNPKGIGKERTYSRILEMTIPVEVEGKDRRKKKLAADFNELNKMLGL